MAASRIQRWASILAGFDNADAFSRLSLPDTDQVPIEKNFLNYVSDRGIDIDNKTIKSETAKDPILSKVFVAVQSGNFTTLVGEIFKPYLRRSNELTTEYGIVMWGYRAFIPTKCRQRLLESIHSSHLGIVRSKAVARSFMWWPGIDAELESLIKSCKSCLSVRPNPPKSNLIPWEVPHENTY